MNYRIAAAVCFLTAFLCTGIRAEQPNIIIILVDDMGWSNIGCYGGMVDTPHLDGLARNGVRFSQFYNGARCCPTRATLMTGLHPHQAGVGHMTIPVRERTDPDTGARYGEHKFTAEDRDFVDEAYKGWLKPSVPKLPQLLQEAGYRTYHTGKWHLANGDQDTWPIQCGFDRYYGHLAGGSDFFRPVNLYRDNLPVQPQGDRYYITDAISDEAINFLEEHEQQVDEQPFFLYLSYNAPHFPLQCMPEDYARYRGKYRDGWDRLREQRLEQQKEMGLVPENTILSPRPADVPAWSDVDPRKQDEMDAIMATYAAMIDRVDQNIGKLIEHLEQTDELDNSLILFLSDNGGEAESGPFGVFNFDELGQYGTGGYKYGKGWATLSNTPFREYKHFTHQGGIQTPLIVHWPAGMPDQPANSILHQFGYLPDIVATCLDVAAAQWPDIRNGVDVPPPDGLSLLKLLSGQESSLHDEPVCIEHEGNRVVRHRQWKLVSYFNKPWELYDIESDRTEINDVAGRNVDVVSELSAAYETWASRVGVLDWQTAGNYSVYRQPDPVRDLNREQLEFQLDAGDTLDRVEAPYIAGRSICIEADVVANGNGVIVAQGGSQYGWSLYIENGRFKFAVCDKGKRTIIDSTIEPVGDVVIRVCLQKEGTVQIYLDGRAVMETKIPELISGQPVDGLQVGIDSQGHVGDYDNDFPFEGEIRSIRIQLEDVE